MTAQYRWVGHVTRMEMHDIEENPENKL